MVCGFSCCAIANAQEQKVKEAESQKPVTKAELKAILDGYPNSSGSFEGDELKIRSNVNGFKTLDDPQVIKCAPISSKLMVSDDVGGNLYVYFKEIPKAGAELNVAEKEGLAECKNSVNLHTLYQIEKANLTHYGTKRTGFAFGALVVPFKFHLGVNEFSSSPTVAPYLGYSWGLLQNRGLKFTTFLSAGMAFVPIVAKDSNTSRTTPAFSSAVGVILTSDKNQNFNAGFLLGHDFLGKSERNFDPKVGKSWVSFYVGYNIN